MQMMQHCREMLPQLTTGHLLGLDRNGVLEVTHAFPSFHGDEGKHQTHIYIADV
jgi:hypothetical protein